MLELVFLLRPHHCGALELLDDLVGVGEVGGERSFLRFESVNSGDKILDGGIRVGEELCRGIRIGELDEGCHADARGIV